MEIAQGGTVSTPKLRAHSWREIGSIKIKRVVELPLEPGIFIPILPSRPTPNKAKSMPP